MQKRLNAQKLNHQFEGYKLSHASIIDTDHALYELIPDANTLYQNNKNNKNKNEQFFAQQPLSFQMKKHLSMHNHLQICPKFHINNDQEEEDVMMSLLFVINELHHVHVYLVNRTFAFMEEPLFIFGEIAVENDELNNGCTYMMCNHKSIHLEQFQNQQTKHWISVLLCSDGYGSLFMNHVNATIATVADVAQPKMSCELMSEWNELQHMFDYVKNERQYEGDYSLFLRHYLPSKIVCAQMLSVTDDEGELIVVLESSLDFCVYRDVKGVTLKPKKRIEFFVSIVKFKFRLCSAEKDDEPERIECLEFKSIDTVYMPSSGLKTGFFRSTNKNQLILVSSSTIRSVKETQQQESMVIDDEEEQVDLEIDVREQVDTNIRGQQTNSSSRFIDHFTSTMDNEDDNTNEGSLSEECHIYELNTSSISLNCLYSNAFQLVVDSIGPSNKYIAVAHDVDVCVYEFNESQNEFCHQYTLHALQYILNGKPNRLFMVYSDQIAVITEQKRVFLYDHQSTDNRTHLAKHQILQLEDDELLLGIRICAGCLFILTQDNIACYSINNSNNNHN